PDASRLPADTHVQLQAGFRRHQVLRSSATKFAPTFGPWTISRIEASSLPCEIAAEELHWRFHVREWVPKWLISAREHHLQHHDRPRRALQRLLTYFLHALSQAFPST